MNDAVPGTRPPFVIESWTFERDVCSMHGNLAKARCAVELARREIDRFYPAASVS